MEPAKKLGFVSLDDDEDVEMPVSHILEDNTLM